MEENHLQAPFYENLDCSHGWCGMTAQQNHQQNQINKTILDWLIGFLESGFIFDSDRSFIWWEELSHHPWPQTPLSHSFTPFFFPSLRLSALLLSLCVYLFFTEWEWSWHPERTHVPAAVRQVCAIKSPLLLNGRGQQQAVYVLGERVRVINTEGEFK